MSERKGMALFAALLMIGLTTCANMAKGEIPTAEFKDMLQSRILEVLDDGPVEDQYAVMFFIYPNEEYDTGVTATSRSSKCFTKMNRKWSTTSTRSFAHPGMMKNDGIRRSGAMIGNGR